MHDAKFKAIAAMLGGWERKPACIIVSSSGKVTASGYKLDDGCNSKMCGGSHFDALERAPSDVAGSTLYTYEQPCEQCEATIIYIGIERIVTYDAS